MTPVAQLTEDMKTALRQKDSQALESIRFILAKVKNAEIDKPNRESLTSDEFVKLVRKQIKDSQDAISQYKAGNRQDLVDAEEAKIQIYARYVPAELSETELDVLVDQVLTENPGLAFGPLIGKVVAASQGRTDGAKAAAVLKKKHVQ